MQLQKHKLKLLSWNLIASPFNNATSLIHDNDNRLSKIIKVIHKEGADVVLLQDVMKDEYKELKHEFPQYDASVLQKSFWNKKNNNTDEIDIGLVEMVNKNSFNSIIFKNNIVYLRKENVSMKIGNIQLDDASSIKRLKQLNDMLLKMSDVSHSIIAGNFNTDIQIDNYNKCIYDPIYLIEKKSTFDNMFYVGFRLNQIRSSHSYLDEMMINCKTKIKHSPIVSQFEF
jgi:hypothetical protein